MLESKLTMLVKWAQGDSFQHSLHVITWVERRRLCFHLCTSICPSVSNITKKDAWRDFHGIFRIGWTWYKEHSGKFGGVMFNPLDIGFLFPCFHENPWLLAALRENGWADSHVIFSKSGKWGKKEYRSFSDVAINPLIPGSILSFYGSVFSVTWWKKLVNGFSRNFQEMSGTTQ